MPWSGSLRVRSDQESHKNPGAKQTKIVARLAMDATGTVFVTESVPTSVRRALPVTSCEPAPAARAWECSSG